MSAVLVAIFTDHTTAETVRSRLVNDGFPTDRVELTSHKELGRAKLVPRDTEAEQLTEYFHKVFQVSADDDQRSVQLAQRAVLAGKATLTVQPRGDVETQRAMELLREGDPVDLQGADLQNTAGEHAAAKHEIPIVTWVGKALAAPGARDTTGTAKLP